MSKGPAPTPRPDVDREKTIKSLIEQFGMTRKQAEQMLAQQAVDQDHRKRDTLQDD